jgi:hypothetical protein
MCKGEDILNEAQQNYCFGSFGVYCFLGLLYNEAAGNYDDRRTWSKILSQCNLRINGCFTLLLVFIMDKQKQYVEVKSDEPAKEVVVDTMDKPFPC